MHLFPPYSYFRHALGAALVYDIANYDTFKRIEDWIKLVREYADPNSVIMLVGNRLDLGHLREVSTEEAKSYAGRCVYVWSKLTRSYLSGVHITDPLHGEEFQL